MFMAGRNAEKAGIGSCCTCGLVSLLAPCNLYFLAKTREATREKFGIEVNGFFANYWVLVYH